MYKEQAGVDILCNQHIVINKDHKVAWNEFAARAPQYFAISLDKEAPKNFGKCVVSTLLELLSQAGSSQQPLARLKNIVKKVDAVAPKLLPALGPSVV